MKVVLAYSGGLDTSISVSLLKERYGAEVITALVDLGQPREEIKDAERRAAKLGILKHRTVDAREEFVRDFVLPAITANLKHEDCYLTPALARPLIALKTIEVAREEGAPAVAHGATERGNDQFIYEYVFGLRAPELKVLTPIKDAGFTRSEEVRYAKEHNIPLPEGYKRTSYVVDANLYGRAVCGGKIEDLDAEPEEGVYELTSSPENAPDKPRVVRIGFIKGIPVKLDGHKMKGIELIEKLNQIAGKHGIGRGDVLHGKIAGIKMRSIIEAPAAALLIRAHRELEGLVLTGEELEFKGTVDAELARLAHDGLAFEPLKEDLYAFVERAQERVSGEVVLRVHKGSISLLSRGSPHAVYSREKATYEGKGIAKEELSRWSALYRARAKLDRQQRDRRC